MTDQDEKTARGHRGPAAVRSTAPAGTPYPVPNPPPAIPAPSASQPRTVGGHTARLLVADDGDIDVGLSDPPSLPGAAPHPGSHRRGPGGEAAPVSSTVGGTQRLDVVRDGGDPHAPAKGVSPEQAASASRKDAETQDAPMSAAAAEGPSKPMAPTIDMGAAKPPAPDPPKPKRADGEPSFLSLLFAPLSVAVGLVFFAMGSMIALQIEGRLIRLSVEAPAAEPVTAPPPPSTTAGPTHTAAHATASPQLVPSTTAAGPAPAHSTAPAPATARPQTGGAPSGTKGGLRPIF